MVHIATFNLFWFPSSVTAMNSRSSLDESLIEMVLTALSADILLFQEILDVPRLGDLLGRIPGRQYHICQASPQTTPSSGTNRLRIVLAFDAGKISVCRRAVLADPAANRFKKGRGLPVVGHFQHLTSGWEFTVVGVHLKSGLHNRFPTGAANAAARCEKRRSGIFKIG